MLVFDFNKSRGGDFAAFHSVNAHADFTAAGEAAVFLPKTLTVRSLEIFRNDGIISVFRGQAVHYKAI